ncbi:MAG: D-2-hydroxyacid dehydrogenase, partial [Acidaminococcaceae bacterium]|nr:D-2-hydroxyacid dehydrogenase [Acidaminococcaceae bacterium]
GMFDEAAFAAMKDGVRFVNISRGKVVDTEALYNALKSGKVAAAGLDVTDPEPLPGDHPLFTLPNVTVTPHMASATEETRDEMALVTAQNIIAALSGQPMLAQVK